MVGNCFFWDCAPTAERAEMTDQGSTKKRREQAMGKEVVSVEGEGKLGEQGKYTEEKGAVAGRYHLDQVLR